MALPRCWLRSVYLPVIVSWVFAVGAAGSDECAMGRDYDKACPTGAFVRRLAREGLGLWFVRTKKVGKMWGVAFVKPPSLLAAGGPSHSLMNSCCRCFLCSCSPHYKFDDMSNVQMQMIGSRLRVCHQYMHYFGFLQLRHVTLVGPAGCYARRITGVRSSLLRSDLCICAFHRIACPEARVAIWKCRRKVSCSGLLCCIRAGMKFLQRRVFVWCGIRSLRICRWLFAPTLRRQ
jgi:hypothetical protein